ncbi:MAG: SH3 domain-containing protein [Chloroflexales bacterium]
MHHLIARLLVSLTVIITITGLGACGDLTSALPERPTPVPTLARLPSVTPVTPSATRPPTTTPVPAVTPTATALSATVALVANVRAGPGLTFAIVGSFDAGTVVNLRQRRVDWFEVSGPNGVVGWMFGQVLEIDPDTKAVVPISAP